MYYLEDYREVYKDFFKWRYRIRWWERIILFFIKTKIIIEGDNAMFYKDFNNKVYVLEIRRWNSKSNQQ